MGCNICKGKNEYEEDGDTICMGARPRQASAAGAGLPKAAHRECRFVLVA